MTNPRVGDQDKRSLALWAADCAEHVLAQFEERYPDNGRPREAIEAARAWARGELPMMKARAAASAGHAAAREADDAAARAAARSAGHAAATAHAAGHARAAGTYAISAATAADPGSAVTERDWQSRRLPEHLRPLAMPVREAADRPAAGKHAAHELAGGKRTFSAPIEGAAGGGAYVTVPFDVEAAFGKKRVPVNATIDGIPYRGSLVRRGGQSQVLGVLKDIRARIGKQVGDVVDVVLEEDAAPRVVDVPPDLEEALRSVPEARRVFEALSFSHKREYVRWIGEAKRSETRSRRIAQAIEMLVRGEHR